MTSSYTLNQGIEKPAAGDQSGTWGATVNTNMDIIDRVVSGVGALTLTGSTTTLTTTDGTLSDGMYRVLVLGDGGDLGSNNTITISPNDADKLYLVYNNLTADRSAIFSQGSGDNATVENGETAWIYADGAGSGAAVRVATSSTKLLDQDGDTGIRVEEGGDDDDTIRFDIAGAEDFTMSANSLNVLTGSVLALPDAAVATPALTNTGDLNTGLYFPAADTLGVTTGGTEQFRFGSNPIPGGSKNMLINGSMAIAQRGSLTGQGGADFYTTCDRWKLDDTAGAQARYTTSQGTSGGVSGKDPWLSINVTTAEAAVASGEKNGWNQFVEGNNTRQIINSSGQIKASAVSFDVKFKKGGGSSLSAPYTMCMTLICENNAYGWVEEISITADDTWEHKSFDITALAQAASDVDTSSGYRLQFMMFAGATYNDGSAGWNSNGGGDPATSNQDNLADATGNILGITNVQWEVGSVATDFAHEDIGTALNECQRYYCEVGVGSCGGALSTSQAIFGVQYPVEMRATPTVALLDTTFYVVDTGGSGLVGAPNAIYSSVINSTGCLLYVNGWSGGNALTQHRPLIIYNYGTNPFSFSAEL